MWIRIRIIGDVMNPEPQGGCGSESRNLKKLQNSAENLTSIIALIFSKLIGTGTVPIYKQIKKISM